MVCVVAGEAIPRFLRACDQSSTEAKGGLATFAADSGANDPASGVLAFILGPGHDLEAYVHVGPVSGDLAERPGEDWALWGLRLPEGRPQVTCRLLAAALEAAAAQGARRLHGAFPRSCDPFLEVARAPEAEASRARRATVLSLAPDAIARVRARFLDMPGADAAPVTGHRFVAASQAAQILGLVSGMSREERSWFVSLAGSAERVARHEGLPAAVAFVRGRLRGDVHDLGRTLSGATMITQGEAV